MSKEGEWGVRKERVQRVGYRDSMHLRWRWGGAEQRGEMGG